MKRFLVFLEAAICLGPLGVMALLGLLMLPSSVGMILAYYTYDELKLDPHGPPYDVILRIVLTFSGLVGFAGAVWLISFLTGKSSDGRNGRAAVAMAIPGIAALVGFNISSGNLTRHAFLEHPLMVLLFFGLPLGFAIHLMSWFLLKSRRDKCDS